MGGAVVGLVPALFTFGLSIPLCAMIGGGAGLCAGTTLGATCGAVGGGAVGYGSYGNRVAIRETVNRGVAFVKARAGGVKTVVESKLGRGGATPVAVPVS